MFVLFCQAGERKTKKKRKERKKKGNIRCGSIVTLGRTHTTMATENNNSNVTNTNTHEHRAQKDCFYIQFFTFYSFIVTVQNGCLSAVVSVFFFVVSRAQSEHGISTVHMAEK